MAPTSDLAYEPVCKKALTNDFDASRTTLFQTVFNLINTFIGGGLLTVPFAFSLGGAATANAVVVVAMMNWATSLFLGHALDKVEKLRPDIPRADLDMKELAGVVFGSVGRQVLGVVLVLEVCVAVVTFLILIGSNVNLICGAPKSAVIVAAGCLATMALWLPMSKIAMLSGLSVLCMFGALVSLVVCGTLVAWSDKDPSEHVVLNVEKLPSAVGLLVFCFSNLPCVPNMRASMRSVEEFPRAVNISFLFTIPYYIAIGVLGYYFFGDATKPNFMANYVEVPGMPYLNVFVGFKLASSALFAVKLQFAAPLCSAAVLQALGFGAEGGAEVAGRIIAARAVFTVASVACAIFARDALGRVAELTGAVLTMTLSLFFPVGAYAGARRLAGEPLAWWEALGLGGMFCVGLGLTASDILRRL